jgi:ornithine cyclodeaminase
MAERQVLILTGDDVRALLPMQDCIAAMEAALAAVTHGESEMPVRMSMRTHDGIGALALMPAHLASSGALGFKAVTVFPGNDAEPTHQGIIALLEPRTGTLFALVDGTAVTTIRTAAVSAVATRHMARRDATTLAILGAGTQGVAHLAAIPLTRAISNIRIWSRSRERAEAAATSALGATAVDSARDAVEGADIVVTATSSMVPILRRAWVAPGTHIVAVGSCIPTARELDADLVAAARVVVDSGEAARVEAGDILMAIADGTIAFDHIVGELGEVIVGRLAGRTSEREITVFESLGLGAEDVAAASLVVDRARQAGRGHTIEL